MVIHHTHRTTSAPFNDIHHTHSTTSAAFNVSLFPFHAKTGLTPIMGGVPPQN